jgi:hypothetical protein
LSNIEPAGNFQPLNEREILMLRKLLGDPFNYPPEFWAAVKNHLEQDPPTFDSSVILGFKKAVIGSSPSLGDWTKTIVPLLYKATVGAWTILAPANVAVGIIQSSGAQNDEISWDIALEEGTWEIELLFSKDTNRGIYTVLIDGAAVGTIDSYAAAVAHNMKGLAGGIVVQTPGKKTLSLKMATKNGASGGYFALLQLIQMRRTA